MKARLFGVILIFVLCIGVLCFVAPVSAADDVAMFRGDPQHTGVYDSVPFNPGTTWLWRYNTNSPVVSSPAVLNGVLYVGSSKNNRTWAIYTGNATKKWDFQADGEIYTSPALSNGLVWISSTKKIYAIDANTGLERWNLSRGSYSSPTPFLDRIFIGGANDVNGEYSRAFAIGSDSPHDVLWSEGAYEWLRTSPAIKGGLVYVASLDYTGFGYSNWYDYHILAFDADQGTIKWDITKYWSSSLELDSYYASPVVGKNLLYIGTNNGLFAYNNLNSTEMWSITTGPIFSTPALKDDILYFGDTNGKFFAVNATDKSEIWNTTFSAGIRSSPIWSGNKVYVWDMDGTLHKLDPASGTDTEIFSLGGAPVRSSPVIVDGIMYVGCDDGYIYAIGSGSPPTEHTITATAGAGGAISPSGSVQVEDGDDQVFTITPALGMQVNQTLVDGLPVTLIGNTYTFNDVTADHAISVTFKQIPVTEHTITATAGAGGAISPSGSVQVEDGNDQVFTITPNLGMQVNQTLVDGSPVTLIGNTYTFNDVTADHTISVTFKTLPPGQHNITATAGTGGMISPSGSVKVNDGNDQVFTITPNLGMQVNQTLVDGSPVTLIGNTYTFNDVTADHTISVTFKTLPPGQHTITATAGTGGTISPSGSVQVEDGNDQVFTITPNTGMQVNQTLVDGLPVTLIGNTYTFNDVTADHTISVTFIAITPTEHTITATAGTGGTITPNGSVIVDDGNDQVFTITPNTGMQVNQTLVDGLPVTLIGNTYTFNDVTADHTISVTFIAITPTEHTITATAGTGGTISPSGSVQVEDGNDQVFTIAPAMGMQVNQTLVDGLPVTLIGNTYTFNDVTADHTISVTFIAITPTEHTITATAGAGGAISPSGSVQVEDGNDQVFMISPAVGMQVNQTLVDGAPVILLRNTYTFNDVTADHTISVTFKSISPEINPLNLTKIDDVPSGHIVMAGESFIYTISYQNPVSFNVTGIRLVDHIPMPLAFISASDGGIFDMSSRTVTWTPGNLAPGQSKVLTLKVQNPLGVVDPTIMNNVTIYCDQFAPYTANHSTIVSESPTYWGPFDASKFWGFVDFDFSFLKI